MSTYAWAMMVVPPELASALRPEVEAALAAPLRSPAREAFEAWREDPAGFAFRGPGAGTGEAAGATARADEEPRRRAFLAAFESREVDELFAAVRANPELDLAKAWLQPPNVPALPWVSAAAVLFYAIGPDRALSLPGVRGNVLVQPDATAAAATRARRALEVPEADLRARALELAPGLVTPEDDLAALRDALPWALEDAARQGAGFLALTCRF